MSIPQAFNTMMKNFLEELADVFPEETQIRLFLDGFDSLAALSPRSPMDMFVESLTPHTDLVMARNPELFQRLEFPGGIDFGKLWTSDISDNTREAIWQYITLLFTMGTTVRNAPPEFVQCIETMAHSLSAKMESGELDFASLGSMLMGGGLGAGGPAGLAGMLSGLGGAGGLADLLSGMGDVGAGGDAETPALPAPTQQPSATSRPAARPHPAARKTAGSRRVSRK